MFLSIQFLLPHVVFFHLNHACFKPRPNYLT
jgi:hypothetical protein